MTRLPPDPERLIQPNRRAVLAAGAGLAATLVVRPATATPDSMAKAIAAFTGSTPAKAGRVQLDIPPLVENGNSVPLTIAVDSPMTEQDHVRRIAVFNQLNPQPNIATFHLNARSGRAQVSTRIRLGDSQVITAVAELTDGSFWSASAELVVTLPACVEN